MNDFVSKLKLYEFFAMLIPGSALLFELYICWNPTIESLFCKCCSCTGEYSCCTLPFEGMYIFAFFVIAYILGCVYHSFVDWWWKPFRNNPTHIAYVYHHKIPQEDKQELSKLFGDQNDEGLCCCSLLQCPCGLLRWVWMAIIVIPSPIYRFCRCICKCHSKNTNIGETLFLDKYYTAYYYAERSRSAAPYSFIEGQIALCRNMILPIILIPFILKNLFKGLCDCVWLFILIAVVLFVFVVCRQEKLYSCVLEDYEYTKRMEANYEKSK